MKTAVAVLPLVMLACLAHALPVEPEALDVAEPHLAVQEEAVSDADSYALVRERRSPQFASGFAGGPGGPGGPGGIKIPLPPPQRPQEPRGTVSGSVHRQPGVGTVVQAQGQGNIWKSKNGNGRLDAQGDWSKVVSGPARGKPNYNVGLSYTHRF